MGVGSRSKVAGVTEHARLAQLKGRRVGLDFGIAHPTAHVRVNAQAQRLEQESAIELDAIKVDGPRFVVLDMHTGLNVPYPRLSSTACGAEFCAHTCGGGGVVCAGIPNGGHDYL